MKKLNKKWLLNTHKLTLIMTLPLIFSIHSVGARHIDMQHNIYEGAVIKPTVPEVKNVLCQLVNVLVNGLHYIYIKYGGNIHV